MNKVIVLLVGALFTVNVHAAELFGADIGVFVSGETTTHDQEAAQLGLTLEWDHVVLEASHGVKKVHWRVESEPSWEMGEWQSGSTVAARFYPFNTRTIRPLLIWRHSSDLLRGDPFNDRDEPTADFLGAGVTFDFNRLEIDIAYGAAGRESSGFTCGENAASNEFQLRIRGFFFGGKK